MMGAKYPKSINVDFHGEKNSLRVFVQLVSIKLIDVSKSNKIYFFLFLFVCVCVCVCVCVLSF